MSKILNSALVVAGLVFTLGAAASWGDPPPNVVASDAHGNTAGGTRALLNNAGGEENTAFGDGGLWDNSTGNYNTAVGYLALAGNTTSSGNTAVGDEALSDNNTGGVFSRLRR